MEQADIVWYGLFLLVMVVLTLYQFRAFFGLLKINSDFQEQESHKAISVIVAAKNESENLERLITKLLALNYPQYEIIWVDDHSDDDSLIKLRKFRDPKLKIYSAPEESSGKKAAIKFGIEQAQYNHLVFIDADCLPASEQWLNHYNQAFQKGYDLVIAHGAFYKTNGLLNQISRYENFWTAVQYLSQAALGKPYMGVGRNLGYTKELYKKSSRFQNHSDLSSGDDDLFVNEIRDKAKATALVDRASFTYSNAEHSWAKYYKQKRRHLLAGTRYRASDRLRLFVGGLSIGLFHLIFIALLATGHNLLLTFTLYLLRYSLLFLALLPVAKKMDEKDLAWKALYLEPLYIVLIMGIGVSTWIHKVDTWK